MKNSLTVLVFSCTLFTGTAFAASGTGTATAEVLPRPITVTVIQGPDFGKFQVGSLGGTLYPYEGSESGDVSLVDASSVEPLELTIAGEPSTLITYGSGDVTLHGPGGATMNIPSYPEHNVILDASGNFTGSIDTELFVGGSQPAGIYNGTIMVNADY